MTELYIQQCNKIKPTTSNADKMLLTQRPFISN